jgi:hypothetical protein
MSGRSSRPRGIVAVTCALALVSASGCDEPDDERAPPSTGTASGADIPPATQIADAMVATPASVEICPNLDRLAGFRDLGEGIPTDSEIRLRLITPMAGCVWVESGVSLSIGRADSVEAAVEELRINTAVDQESCTSLPSQHVDEVQVCRLRAGDDSYVTAFARDDRHFVSVIWNDGSLVTDDNAHETLEAVVAIARDMSS